MSRLLLSLGIGAIAGLIDVIPMVVQRLDRYSTVSAFVQWVVLGFLISYVRVPLAPWLKGLVIAEMAALPIIALLAGSDPKSIPIVAVMSAILGALVGIATTRFAA